MSDKATTIVCFYAAAAFFIALTVGYHITYPVKDPNTEGFIVFIAAVGALALTAGTCLIAHSLWEGGFSGAITRLVASIGSLFNFIGKVFLGIWGVTITVAIAYVYYLYVVEHALFK